MLGQRQKQAQAILIILFFCLISLLVQAQTKLLQQPATREGGNISSKLRYAIINSGEDEETLAFIKQSKSVTSTKEWKERSYRWLSDTQIIYVTEVKVNRHLYVFNLPSGQSRRLSTPKRYLLGGPGILSPNGKWLAGIIPEIGGASTWFATTLDGTEVMTGPISIYRRKVLPVPGAWRKDNIRWMTLVGTNKGALVVTYNLDKPETFESKRLPRTGVEDKNYPGDAPPVLGFNAAEEALVVWVQPQPPAQVTIARFNPDEAPPQVQTNTVEIPSGARADEYVLSPQGDRLAWLFYFRRDDKAEPRTEIWLSDASGQHMKKVGGIVTRSPYPYHGADFIREIQWHPGGKQLSFIYENVLFTFSVD
jgi:hypothetical protein